MDSPTRHLPAYEVPFVTLVSQNHPIAIPEHCTSAALTLPCRTAMFDCEAVRRAGGYLQLQGAIAFRAWRLHQDSITVADSLGLTSMNIRVTLQRLRDTAEQLGFPVGKHHPTRGTKRRKSNRVEQIAVNADSAVQFVNEARRAGLRIDDFASYVDFARRLNIIPMQYEHWRMLEPQCKPQKLRSHQAAVTR